MDGSEVRRAAEPDTSDIARILLDSFLEYRHLYTPEAFAATTPDADVVARRLGEGPTWVVASARMLEGTVSAVARADGTYIRSMAVLPSARGKGIGRALLEAVEIFAVERGAPRLYLSTTPFLTDAIRLYEASGFRRTDDPPHDLHGTPLFTMEKRSAAGA